jgi:hypothetical protein
VSFPFCDNAKQTSTTTGTADYELDAPTGAFDSLATRAGSGNPVFWWAIGDSSDARIEWGYGVITAGSPDTLARTTIIGSTTGSKLSWGAGTRTIVCAPIGEVLSSLFKTNKGSSRPTWLPTGGLWVNDSVTPWAIKFYDGTNDVSVGTVDTSSHVFAVAGGVKLDTSATPWKLTYNDGTNDVVLGTINASTHVFTARAQWTKAVISSSNAAWAVPAGTSEMIIEGWGAGGSGAGGNTTTPQRGSGAGAGGYFRKRYSGTMDSTLNITIGAGGAAVASSSSGANGNDGGDTTIVGTNLGTLTAGGGKKGLSGVNQGGAGGAASGGDENLTGQDGQTSWSTAVLAAAFAGGDSPRGGRGGRANVGVSGNAPGGGGSCGNHTAATNSGAGANGLVIIWTR